MANENVKNIFGIDLNVDKDYLSDIVKKSVMSSVAQALTDGDNGCVKLMQEGITALADKNNFDTFTLTLDTDCVEVIKEEK